jgi:hypothetical protein
MEKILLLWIRSSLQAETGFVLLSVLLHLVVGDTEKPKCVVVPMARSYYTRYA